uniref:Uncharacterized protein n=1 Tax=Glossina brevipalpis TaxID=37001 RepID=A0A1A9WDA2_9MUSC
MTNSNVHWERKHTAHVTDVWIDYGWSNNIVQRIECDFCNPHIAQIGGYETEAKATQTLANVTRIQTHSKIMTQTYHFDHGYEKERQHKHT